MANTTPLTYRIDSNLKQNAESILLNLGMTPTVAIQMFYKQIIVNNGLPFVPKLETPATPVNFDSLCELLDN